MQRSAKKVASDAQSKTDAQPKRARSKPVDIPKRQVEAPSEECKARRSVAETRSDAKPRRLTPKQKNEALKLKLQQLLDEM